MKKIYLRFAERIEQHLRLDARYFLSGGFWLLVAQAATIISSLITTVFLTRLLTENEFGIYRYVIGIGVLLSAFSLTGISQSILQASAKGYRSFLSRSTPVTLRYSVGISSISSIVAVYYLFQGNLVLGVSCLFIAILQPLPQLFLNTMSHLYGEGKFMIGAKVQAYKAIFVSGSTLVTLSLSQNLIFLLLSYFLSQAIIAVFIYLMYRPKSINKEVIPNKVMNKYISYAQHTSFRNLIIGTASRLDTLIIFQQLGAPTLAMYTVAMLIPEQIKGSFKNLQTLLIPKYSKHESLESIKQSIPKRSVQFFGILCILSLSFIIIIPYFYSLLFPGYTEAVGLVQILVLSFPASIYLIPVGAMQAQQLEKTLYLYNVVTSVMLVVTLFVLVFSLGVLGAIWARVIGQYINAALAYLFLYTVKSSSE